MKTLRMLMCAAVAAALGTFGTVAQATFYGGDFDPFTGTFSLNVSDGCNSDGCTITLLPGMSINSSIFGCCFTSPGQSGIGEPAVFDEGTGALIAFDSELIPLSFISDVSLERAFTNDALPCATPSLRFTSTFGTDMNGDSGYLAQLVCASNPQTVLDDATYHLARVPEPGTLALILGGIGAGWLTRRRKAAH